MSIHLVVTHPHNDVRVHGMGYGKDCIGSRHQKTAPF